MERQERAMRQRTRKEPSPGPGRFPKRRKEQHHQNSHQRAGYSPGNKEQEPCEVMAGEVGAWRKHEHLEASFGKMNQCHSY